MTACKVCQCGNRKHTRSVVCSKCRRQPKRSRVRVPVRPLDIEERIVRLADRAERGVPLFQEDTQ